MQPMKGCPRMKAVTCRFLQSLGPAGEGSGALLDTLGCQAQTRAPAAVQPDRGSASAQPARCQPAVGMQGAPGNRPPSPRPTDRARQHAAVAARHAASAARAARLRQCQTAQVQSQFRPWRCAATSQACKLQAVRLVTACC